MFEWFKRISGIKAAPTTKKSSSVVLFEGTWLQWPSWDMRAQIEEGLERNSVVYACINLIARTASTVPWCLYEQRGKEKVEIEQHELLTLLKRPNSKNGGPSFVYELFTYLLCTGNSYMWANRIGTQPKELWSLRPDRVAIQPGKTLGTIEHYILQVQGVPQNLKPEDVLHLRLFQSLLNEWFGLSPVQVGALLVDTDNKAVNWNRSLLTNRGRPDSMIDFKQTLSDEQRAEFKRRWDEEHSGSKSVGRPIVVEGSEFTYQQLSSTPVEMDFVASSAMTGRRICQLYNVPPELIGDPQNRSYNNQKEAKLALVESIVFPLLDYLAGELNNWIVKPYGEHLYLEYNKDAVDVVAEKRFTMYQTLAVADWLSVNEKREACGYSPVEDEDANKPERLLGGGALYGGDIGGDVATTTKPDDEPEEPESEPEDGKKFWNLDTLDQRVSYWKSFDTLRRALEKRAQPVIAKKFAQEKATVIAVIRGHYDDGTAPKAVEKVVLAKSKAMQSALLQIYRGAAAATFRDTLRSLPRNGKTIVGLEEKDAQTALRGLSAYLNARAKDNAAKIAETTNASLADLLKEMILGGKSNEEVVDAVTKLYEDHFQAQRSKRIAETEVGTATNAGVIFAGKSLDRPLLKDWISMGDERVRDPENGSDFSHRDENVKSVGIDDLFEVSGEKLEFPGDSSHGASPGNVIQCRCVSSLRDPTE